MKKKYLKKLSFEKFSCQFSHRLSGTHDVLFAEQHRAEKENQNTN